MSFPDRPSGRKADQRSTGFIEGGTMTSHRASAFSAFGIAAVISLSIPGHSLAADMPVKAVNPPPDIPFFLIVDNRASFSWMPKGTDPGMFRVKPGGAIEGTTAK